MNDLHDALALIERTAAADFTATGLAQDHSPVTRAVRRARVARASVSSLSAAVVVIAGAWAANALGLDGEQDPGTTTQPFNTDPTQPAPLGDACATRARAIDPENFAAYYNANLPNSVLCYLWDGETTLRADAAVALGELNSAYLTDTGETLCIELGYGPLPEEHEVYSAGWGTEDLRVVSDHGWGLAVDLCSSPEPDFQWLLANAGAYGWNRPAAMATTEPHHWIYGDAYFATLHLTRAPELPSGTIRVDVGTTTAELASELADYFDVTTEEAAAAISEALPPGAGGEALGWMTPGTYGIGDFDNVDDAAAFVLGGVTDELSDMGVPEAEWSRTVILASLVEAESRRTADMPAVARVIENRLEAGMLLQLDSTIEFVTGIPGPVSVEQTSIDSPYNTYKYPGLPEGPIRNPSPEALAAATRPADGEWLFFIVVDLSTGEMRLAETYPEHLENVALLQEWYEANGG
jgi:hypothetical protein